ncbi:MAG: M20 family metallopeptidase [Actinomycetota bacterium]
MTQLANIGEDLLEEARGLQDATVELRRSIHAEPELGLENPLTQQKVVESLSGLGLDIKLGESTTSVVADLDSGKPGPTILLRGDMDALPLQEDHVTDYQSRFEGRMHACGHDTHTAMLASAARLLSENTSEFTGKVRFMFQPGEEGFHGARYMIEEGVLEDVDKAFALHITTTAPNGMIATRRGAILASADRFEITVNGNGGHASAPQDATDPIPPAAAMVGNLQTMMTREVAASDPAVLTVARIEAGTTNNIIPSSAFLEGTIRTYSEKARNTILEAVPRVASGTAWAHGCTCNADIIPGYPVTINDPAQAEHVGEVAKALVGADDFVMLSDPIMAAEDFSYVLNEVPGAMVMLGACPDDVSPAAAEPLHSNLMRVNESAFYRGVALYAAMAIAG